jgi:hypothetical protein
MRVSVPDADAAMAHDAVHSTLEAGEDSSLMCDGRLFDYVEKT